MKRMFKIAVCFVVLFSLTACKIKKTQTIKFETLYLEKIEFLEQNGKVISSEELKKQATDNKEFSVTFKDEKSCEFFVPGNNKEKEQSYTAHYTLNNEKITISSDDENWEGTYNDGVLKIKLKEQNILATFKRR